MHAGTNTVNVTMLRQRQHHADRGRRAAGRPGHRRSHRLARGDAGGQPGLLLGSGSVVSSSSSDGVADTRKTLAQTVDALNSSPTNDTVRVSFLPGVESAWPGDVFYTDPASQVIGTVHSNWVVGGSIAKQVKSMNLRAVPAAVKKNKRVTLRGAIMGLNSTTSVMVKIYRRYLGTTTTRARRHRHGKPGSHRRRLRLALRQDGQRGGLHGDLGRQRQRLGTSASLMVPLRRH